MRRLAALMLLTMSPAASTLAAEVDVWLGTVTSPNGSRGIYHVALDDETGKLSRSQLVAPIKQPGFLALHPELPVLYSTGGGGWRLIGSGAAAVDRRSARSRSGRPTRGAPLTCR